MEIHNPTSLSIHQIPQLKGLEAKRRKENGCKTACFQSRNGILNGQKEKGKEERKIMYMYHLNHVFVSSPYHPHPQTR
jgi:hypothetical protein